MSDRLQKQQLQLSVKSQQSVKSQPSAYQPSAYQQYQSVKKHQHVLPQTQSAKSQQSVKSQQSAKSMNQQKINQQNIHSQNIHSPRIDNNQNNTKSQYKSLLEYVKNDCMVNCINNSTYSAVYFTKDYVIKEQKNIDDYGFSANIKEILFLMELNHQNIIKIMAIEPNPNHTFNIILPRYDMTLNKFISTVDIYTRVDIYTKMVRDLFRGVGYLHSLGVIHSDIKPTNIYIRYRRHLNKLQIANDNLIFDSQFMCADNSDPNSPKYLIYEYDIELVIADFNISKLCINWEPKDDTVQTPNYRAPEVECSRYDYKIDVWSIGCIIMDMFNRGNIYWKFENSLQEFCRIYNITYTGVYNNDYAVLMRHISENTSTQYDKFRDIIKKINIIEDLKLNFRPDAQLETPIETHIEITPQHERLIHILADCLCVNSEKRKNAHEILSEYFGEKIATPRDLTVDITDDNIEMKMPNGEILIFDFEGHTRYMATKLWINIVKIITQKISDGNSASGQDVLLRSQINYANIYTYPVKLLKRFCYYLAAAFFDDNHDYQFNLINKYQVAPIIIFQIIKFIQKNKIKLFF